MTEEMPAREAPLSLGEFVWGPRVNNFYLYFVPGEFGDMYRSKPHYQLLARAHPELEKKILGAFEYMATEDMPYLSPDSTIDERNKFQQKFQKREHVFNANRATLYEAYCLMRAETDDKHLFA